MAELIAREADWRVTLWKQRVGGRFVAALRSPAIVADLGTAVFIGGLWAFFRLLILMLLALTMGLPIIAGPAIGG